MMVAIFVFLILHCVLCMVKLLLVTVAFEDGVDAFLLVFVPIGGLLLLVLFYYCLKVPQIVIFSHFRPFFIIFWSARALQFHQKEKA